MTDRIVLPDLKTLSDKDLEDYLITPDYVGKAAKRKVLEEIKEREWIKGREA